METSSPNVKTKISTVEWLGRKIRWNRGDMDYQMLKGQKKCTKYNLLNLSQRNIGSPVAQRSFSHRTNTTIPSTTETVKPMIIQNVTDELPRLRVKQKKNAEAGSKLNVGNGVLFQQKHRQLLQLKLLHV